MGNLDDKIDNFCAGAVAALSYMAEAGASKEQVLAVADIMDLSLDDIDEADRERLVAAYGEI